MRLSSLFIIVQNSARKLFWVNYSQKYFQGKELLSKQDVTLNFSVSKDMLNALPE